MDYAALRGRIRTVYGTQEAFARAMDRSPCSISFKLNGRSEWTAAEIRKACELLDIRPDEVTRYFFCPEC